jgi:hypothetical protein
VINNELFFKCKKIEGADGKKPWTDLPAQLPHAFELYLDALVGKDVSLIGARETAYRGAVMEAMYEGAKTGKWVGVKASQ